MSNQCTPTHIFARSFALATTIDVPIGTLYAGDYPQYSMTAQAVVTFIAAFICYAVRETARNCDVPYLNPYISPIIGGSAYAAIIDITAIGSIKPWHLFEGSTRQIGYELYMNFKPVESGFGTNIASALAVEVIQNMLIEGRDLKVGVLGGLYVGVALTLNDLYIEPFLEHIVHDDILPLLGQVETET